MSALLLVPETGVTVTSATNVASASSKDWLIRDELGLDARFTADTVIVIDRGAVNSAISWDCLAFVQSTIPITATVKIEYSNDSTFATGVTTIGPATVAVVSVVSSRRKAWHHELASATTARFIRITFASAGAHDLGRIITGAKIKTLGVESSATRTFDDRSIVYEAGAYQVWDERPTLLGWKVTFDWQSEANFRSIWIPFYQTVGNKKAFYFLPLVEDSTTWQGDWMYGRIQSKAEATHQGQDMWVCSMTARSLYP